MFRVQVIILQALAMAVVSYSTAAEEVRYYEENGVTYRETRQIVQRPASNAASQPQTRTVCREQWGTEKREFLRTTFVPVTQYRPETYWVGLWNPFDEPYLETRYVPVTVLQAQTDRVTLPVAVRRVVPETQVVQAPSNANMVCEQIISRVPVHGAPGVGGGSSAQVASSGRAPLRPTPANVASRPASPLSSSEWPTGTAARTPSVTAPANIPTPAYVRSPAPAPAYAPPGGYTTQPSYTAAAPSPAYGSPYNAGTTASDGQRIGGVSRLDRGPSQWGNGSTASGVR